MNCTPFPFCPTGPLIHWRWGGFFTGLISLGLFALWIWTLVDVLTKESDENSNRLIWGLVVGLTYVIGAIIYLIARRPERIRKLGR
jgi:hypothetical protein